MRTVDLTIHDVAFGGKGVARDDGKAIFVPFTIDGERVSARVVREKRQFAEAELIEILEPSPHRVAAPCPYFGRCGGCAYQHISYDHQLEFKARQVDQAMRRIARLSEPPLQPIVRSPLPYAYGPCVHARGRRRFLPPDVHLKSTSRSIMPVKRRSPSARRARRLHPSRSLRSARLRQTNDVADAIADLPRHSCFRTGTPDDAFGAVFRNASRRVSSVIGIDWDRSRQAAKDARPNRNLHRGRCCSGLARRLGQPPLLAWS